MRLHTKILLGLLLGAIAGVTANLTLGGADPRVVAFDTYVAAPVGQVFLRMLFMVVMPLVFASIALGVAGMGDIRKVGKVGGKALGYFLVTTAISGTVGILGVSLARPGERLDPAVRADLVAMYGAEAGEKAALHAKGGFGIDTLVGIVTKNPLRSAVEGDMLGVIFFALLFGIALTLIDERRGKVMVDVLGALEDVMVKIVEIAMRLAPYGVAGLVFGVTARFGFALLVPLGGYVSVVLGGLLFHGVVVMSLLVVALLGISPRAFFRRVRPSLVTAFSTSSSAATLPTNIKVAEDDLGVPPKIAGFVLPLGATMCMNGTALFEGVTVLFLCQVFGVELSIVQMAIVVAMTVMTAVGAAGVPGGSMPLLVGILAMFGVPGEAIAVVLGVDRILDMARTTLNVLGDLVAAAFVARSEGAWTPADLPPLAIEPPIDQSPDWPREDEVVPRMVPVRRDEQP